MKKLRKIFAVFLLAAFLGNFANAQTPPSSPSVVINEISWTGTAANSADEWIELYNTTSSDINLSGWRIEDDDNDQIYSIGSGTIAAGSYFLIEDSQETTSIAADLIANLSLSNTGDKLVLKNASGDMVDIVNTNAGNWYAGNNTTKASMERRNASDSNDSADNWTSNSGSNGALDRNGNVILGTPRSINSASTQRASVNLIASKTNPANGETISVEALVSNAQNLFSYGFDIVYNPAVLEFINATDGNFLNENGNISTSFQAGLENGTSGKLVVAEARLSENSSGVSGNGSLFAINFRVIGADGANSNITLAANSFLANPTNDLTADFTGVSVSVAVTVTPQPQNLRAAQSTNRYELSLSWQSSVSDVDRYKILRKNASAVFVEIGSTTALNFVDNSKIIPNLEYEYQLVAIKNGRQSTALSAIQKDSRGIKGDNNRSDRVDGRDLEQLARHFAETTADQMFEPLIDTSYDGRIDGNDLLDIAANWALQYTST